ncbi:hypothetical protein CP970_21710 [Streptomyces kanamyceticus]|uniref:Uncharacterized protein n=2 Tax=Streptomyces kanamyceticus TaxID=1967 RepID=A0A5J6GGR4_STRKN|nr:hypothetical protein [Streptomyces kanamyceticus]QEU93191.1 hypothetical protein CP970_21710 [Streptomyces kanamyceticus]
MTASEPSEGPLGIQQLWTIVGTIIAPTSMATALLYYFGWHHAYWFFDYFGVNSTVLGFSTADYLMRSLDALYVPLTVTAGASLLAFWGHDLLRRRLTAGHEIRLLRRALPIMTGVGALLTLGGFWSVLSRTFFLRHILVAAPLSLAFGVLLLAYTLHLWRTLPNPPPDEGTSDPENDTELSPPPPATPAPPEPTPAPPPRPPAAALAEWGVVLVLVGLGLFWAANDYAAAVGETRAREFAADLPTYPYAIVYSADSLSLTAPGVRETRCRDPKAAYRFRYDGLKLMLQSGNQYVLVPELWSRAGGVAVLLPRSSSVRLEFAPPLAGSGASKRC